MVSSLGWQGLHPPTSDTLAFKQRYSEPIIWVRRGDKSESGQMVLKKPRPPAIPLHSNKDTWQIKPWMPRHDAELIPKFWNSSPGGHTHRKIKWLFQKGSRSKPVIDKSLDLEKSREEMTPYFLARSRKLDFHFSFYSRFSRFLEKNSISLLDLWDF